MTPTSTPLTKPCPACTTGGRTTHDEHNLAASYSGERTYNGKQVAPPMSRRAA